MSREVADHLRYYAELGVTGLSRDPQWRERADKGADDVTPGIAQTESGLADVLSGFGPATAVIETLDDIKTDIGPACTRCKLCTLGRTQIVFGMGHAKARLMFVGEAPGEEEDQRGEPFVGRSGQLLTKIIEAIGLSREQVYIANVIKCRPPNNRNPEPDEVAACEPFLFRQIDVIKPAVIVPLGKFAAQCLLKTTDPITRLRGRRFDYRGTTLIPTFHPAYLLRNPSAKREVWEDMKLVRAILQGDA
jgi:uracil-DNA glycosylase family 4